MIKVKKLELDSESNLIQRLLGSSHAKKTLTAVLIGGLIGFLYFYISEGQYMVDLTFWLVSKSILIGMGFGAFITNSPCSRGKC